MNALRSILLRREAGIAVMIVLFCLAVGAVKPQFLTLDQLRIILLLTPLIMIGAMGQMLVLVARHVDLSIGSMLGVSAMVSGMLYRFDATWFGFDVPWWTGIPLSIAVGALLGLGNGVLILDEPTRGIDIGVKAEFYDMIGELAASGRAILLISSELPELLALCDRVLVMSEGRLTADIPRAEATQEAIMSAAVPRKLQQGVAA